ncbi:response regulator [Litoribrevibacter albus]|uniref:DNA-binding response regulator n=1 Tax=Litoribrevibacter albus TaxID=1473156 RepID=A0AA37SBB9_9GAMM|nr:response regulator transcription factor [Litoribrevibacter albus]GLQ32019.1 DNA-binding response regulator [Litoribrevibacter albus]
MNSKAHAQQGLNLLLIDDHQIYLDGLSMSLSLMESVASVYQATCLEEAETILGTITPDIILLDLHFPQVDGFHIMSHIEAQCSGVPIIILSGSNQPDDVRQAMRRGAKGFLSKSANGIEIREAIAKVANGESLQPLISVAVDNGEQNSLLSQVRISIAREHRITQRQAEVLVLLAEGMSNKHICRRLELTEATVKFHLKALFLALDVHNRTECVSVARRLNILV